MLLLCSWGKNFWPKLQKGFQKTKEISEKPFLLKIRVQFFDPSVVRVCSFCCKSPFF